MTDRMTLNVFLRMFSDNVLFSIRYRNVIVAITYNTDERVLSLYYRFYVTEYRVYPEGTFVTVSIDD